MKQSEALETHAEQWHESVLAAVAPRQEEDEGLQQQAAPWVSRGQPGLSAAGGEGRGGRESGAGETVELARAAHEALLL